MPGLTKEACYHNYSMGENAHFSKRSTINCMLTQCSNECFPIKPTAVKGMTNKIKVAAMLGRRFPYFWNLGVASLLLSLPKKNIGILLFFEGVYSCTNGSDKTEVGADSEQLYWKKGRSSVWMAGSLCSGSSGLGCCLLPTPHWFPTPPSQVCQFSLFSFQLNSCCFLQIFVCGFC